MKQWYQKLLSVWIMLGIMITSISVPAFAADTKQVMIELTAETNDQKAYLPNETVPYHLVVKNKLGSSWIRVKITCSEENLQLPFTEQYLNFAEGWVKKGDYYYLCNMASAYSDYSVTYSFRIPDYSSVTKQADATVTITVNADAIQGDALQPDFSKENPWDGAKITYSTSSHSSSSGGSGGSSNSNGLVLYSSPQGTGTLSYGQWELADADSHIWKFRNADGTYVKNGWVYVSNPYSKSNHTKDWFHFDANGALTYGWWKTPEDDRIWYYTHEISDGDLGMQIRGWHTDESDGNVYYLDEKTGIMLSGWQQIGEDEYYFATYDQAREQTWFYRLIGNTSVGKWFCERAGYRSYGAMYVNEKTPDGYTVGIDGKKVKTP